MPNTDVLYRAGLPTMYTLLRKRRLRWLGHVHRMEDGRIPKDILYGELASGKRAVGRPQLRYKDVCKRDMRALDIDTECWEEAADNRTGWRGILHSQLRKGEEKFLGLADEKRARRKARNNMNYLETIHKCDRCGRDCHSRIGLTSHSRSCSRRSASNS